MSGKLRLYDPEDRDFGVASSVSVTWKIGLPLIITSVHAYQQWNGRNVDFILLRDGQAGTLVAEGYGIKPETRAKLGAFDLTTRSCTGTTGNFDVPYQATTGTVQFVCGPATVLFPTPIKVGVWPKMDPASYVAGSPVMLFALNTEYSLRGWGFKPTIAGLVMSLNFHFSQGLPLQLQVIEQTDNLIRFKIVATGPLPSNYLSYREFASYGQFQIYGQYQGGTPQSMLAREYRLVAQ